MRLNEIIELLAAEVIVNKDDTDVIAETACASDLMSDVLSFAKPGGILLTGLTTIQVIYTAELAELKAICFVRGKRPPKDTVRLAESKGVVLLRTNLPMFESCGRLHEHGLKGCSHHDK